MAEETGRQEEQEKKLTVEQTFEQLETLIGRLEDPETELLEAVDLYGKGVALVRQCQDVLDMVEKQIIILEGDGDEQQQL